MSFITIVPADALATSRMAGDYDPRYSFDINKPLCGNDIFPNTKSDIANGGTEGNQWLSQFLPIDPQWPIKLNADLGAQYDVRRIYYENSHCRGWEVNVGFNQVEIYGTNSEAAYREVRGEILTDLTLLWSGNFKMHKQSSDPNTSPFVSGNISDPYYIGDAADNKFNIDHGKYRYYVFVVYSIFYNQLASHPSHTGVRRLALQYLAESSSSLSSISSSSSTEIRSSSSSSSTEIRSSSSSSSAYIGAYYICGDLSPNAEGEYIYAGFGKPHPESPTWSERPVPVPDFNYWQLNDIYYLGLISIPEIGLSTAIIFDFDEKDELCHQWVIYGASSIVGIYEPASYGDCATYGYADVSLIPCVEHSSSSFSSSSSSSTLIRSSSSSSSSGAAGFTFSINLAAPQTFTLPLTDLGLDTPNFVVDWGDNTSSAITAWDDLNKTHSYADAGGYTVVINGYCPSFMFNNGTDKSLVTSVSSWGRNIGFKYLNFFGCDKLTSLPDSPEERGRLTQVVDFIHFVYGSGLTSIPAGIFDYNTTATSFDSAFAGCASLMSIPDHLFDNCSLITTFSECFWGTNITSIPSGLFDNNTLVNSFSYCFGGNLSLLTIPSGLFDNNPLVTNFTNCFYGCTHLISIPVDLFKYNINVTDFSVCFYNCDAITSIPTGLFDSCSLVTTFSNCFYGCAHLTTIPTNLFKYNINVRDFSICFERCYALTTIPSGLFDNNPLVTNFQECFYACVSVTSIPDGLFDYNPLVNSFYACFGSCQMSSIPADLFKYNVNATEFSTCFQYCTSLTSVPAGLFDHNVLARGFYLCFRICFNLRTIPAGLFDHNPLVREDLAGVFVGCSSLESIPDGLFDYNVNLNNAGGMFYGCTSLTSIPAGLFDNNPLITTFAQCFTGCTGLTSLAPELWARTPSAIGTDCFLDDVNLANYDAIPEDWGGPAVSSSSSSSSSSHH